MNSKHAAQTYTALRRKGYHAVARFIPRGELGGEDVVELEPGRPLHTTDFDWLIQFAAAQGVELSFGRSTRRVVTLS